MSGNETTVTEKHENLWNTYNALNEWIRFSDTKATALLAINGVITGFYFSNIAQLKSILSDKPITCFPLLMIVVFIFLSSLFSMFCIIPRLKINKKDSLIFFYDIAKKYSNVEEYQKAVEESLIGGNFKKELSSQIWANSKVSTKKYDWVTFSICFFVATIFFSLVFVTIGFL